MVSICIQHVAQLASVADSLAAFVLLASAFLPGVGCGKADSRVPVHPVLGAIQFRGPADRRRVRVAASEELRPKACRTREQRSAKTARSP